MRVRIGTRNVSGEAIDGKCTTVPASLRTKNGMRRVLFASA
jgi:hypothetical protein